VETVLACYAQSDHELCQAVGLELYDVSDNRGPFQFEIQRVLEITASHQASARRLFQWIYPGNVHVLIKIKYCDPERGNCDRASWTREGYTVAKVSDRWHVIDRSVGLLADFTADVALDRVDNKMMETLCGCYQQTLECAIPEQVERFLFLRDGISSCECVVESTGSWMAYFVVTENKELSNRVDHLGVEHDEIRYVSVKAGFVDAESYLGEIVYWYNHETFFTRDQGIWEAKPEWLMD
jgi:hypothetical protein